MNIKSLNTLLIAAGILSLAACNKENGLEQAHQDRSLSFDLSMAAASHDTDESGASTKSLEIKSADGSITLPLEYRVTDGMGEISLVGEVQTKGEQINYNPQLQTSIGLFKVKAWNSNHSVFLPTGDSEESTVNFTNGKWTLDGETAPLWMNADVKTFLAYSNLPTGAEVAFNDETSLTFSYPDIQTDATTQKDALLGYYKGNGDRDGDGVADGEAKIQFVHPLTAVVFKQGEFIGITAIKRLSIEGVYKGGEAVVTYSYDPDGNLVPTFDWETSSSETTEVFQTGPDSGALPVVDNKIGEPFIILPQDLSTDKVTIKAVVTAASVDQEIMAELNTGSWVEGKTNTYTLGYDATSYTYTFTLNSGASSGTQFFTKTTSETVSIGIVNNKTDEGGQTSYGEWLIESVQVGSGAVETLNVTSFTDKGGFSALQKDVTTLEITASERNMVCQGTNDYWRNDPVRTENLGWSPADWSNTKATATSPLDLSKFNFQDETTDNPMTTANCYIIRHAGTYKLPLVYGNAVVNGEQYIEAFAPVKPSGAKNFLTPFMNHLGNSVTDAFIENHANYGDMLKCAIVWQDKAAVIEDISIVGNVSETTYNKDNVRYLQFSISQNNICQNNALICVYKDANDNDSYDSGEAVWSWHIWTTNDPALLSDPISVTNFVDQEYKFFPLYNLGWLSPNEYPAREDVKIVLAQKKSGNKITLTVKQNAVPGLSKGCWYQFGRKDPFPTADVSGFDVSAGPVPLSTAILNPGVFYTGSSDWNDKPYDNLWTGSGNSKTIYDPSPVGYKMPAYNAFTGFNNTGGDNVGINNVNAKGNFIYGWNFYTVKHDQVTESTETIYFSAAGNRDGADASLTTPEEGMYWLSAATYYLTFNKNRVMPHINWSPRTKAASVRPVQE